MRIKIFILIVLVIFMAINVWGLLAKSMVDGETVEQAIARLIAAHEADETSHLGAGESLQSHKASEVIDHVVDSIIEDKIADGQITSNKITNNQILAKDFRTAQDVGAGVDGVKMVPTGIEMWQSGVKMVDIPVSGNPTFEGTLTVQNVIKKKFVIDTIFESLDGYYTYTNGTGGVVDHVSVGCVALVAGSQSGKIAEIGMTSGFMSLRPKTDELIFEAGILANDDDDGYWVAGANINVDLSYAESIGFYYTPVTHKLFAVSIVASDVNQIEIVGIDFALPHNFRFECLADRINFYVDNVLVAMEYDNLPNTSGEAGFGIQLKSYNTNNPILLISEVRYIQTRDITPI